MWKTRLRALRHWDISRFTRKVHPRIALMLTLLFSIPFFTYRMINNTQSALFGHSLISEKPSYLATSVKLQFSEDDYERISGFRRFGASLNYTIHAIGFNHMMEKYDDLCLIGIENTRVSEPITIPLWESNHTAKSSKQIVCSSSSISGTVFLQKPWVEQIYVEYNSKYYPYDIIEYRPDISFVGYYKNNPNQLLYFPASGDVSVFFANREIHFDHGSRVYQSLRIYRPLLYRILTPIMLITLTIFISVLLFITDISSMSQIALAILFSLWSTREIIIIDNIRGPIVLDSIFLSLYIYLAAVCTIQLIYSSVGRKVFQKKE